MRMEQKQEQITQTAGSGAPCRRGQEAILRRKLTPARHWAPSAHLRAMSKSNLLDSDTLGDDNAKRS